MNSLCPRRNKTRARMCLAVSSLASFLFPSLRAAAAQPIAPAITATATCTFDGETGAYYCIVLFNEDN